MIDMQTFETKKWSKLDSFQRIEALQQLENSMALEQGRIARRIQYDNTMSPETRGQYSPMQPTILRVNAALIDSPDGNYQAMQTTIHEGRHAYQDDCVTGRINPLKQDKELVELWRHNMPGRGGEYNSPAKGFTGYRFQPVEADANRYAKSQIDSLHEQFSKDPSYQRFCLKRDIQDQYSETVARNTYGDDYEKVIENDINSRYQVKQMKNIRCVADKKNNESADVSTEEGTKVKENGIQRAATSQQEAKHIQRGNAISKARGFVQKTVPTRKSVFSKGKLNGQNEVDTQLSKENFSARVNERHA